MVRCWLLAFFKHTIPVKITLPWICPCRKYAKPIKSMKCNHKNCMDDLGLMLLQPMVVPRTDSERVQNDLFMVSDSLFANFLIIIHAKKN